MRGFTAVLSLQGEECDVRFGTGSCIAAGLLRLRPCYLFLARGAWQPAGCYGFCRVRRLKVCLKPSYALSREGTVWRGVSKSPEEYAAWFTDLVKEDLASAVQVA